MKIRTLNVRLVVVAAGLSGVLHLLFWIASPKALGFAIEVFMWPALLVGFALNSILPSSMTVQYDPLPHPVVWWVAVPINVAFWAALACVVIWALRIGVRRGKS